jgi:hypothetical protein
VFFCVLLAIVYVLSRTGAAASCDTPATLSDFASFDIGCVLSGACSLFFLLLKLPALGLLLTPLPSTAVELTTAPRSSA